MLKKEIKFGHNLQLRMHNKLSKSQTQSTIAWLDALIIILYLQWLAEL